MPATLDQYRAAKAKPRERSGRGLPAAGAAQSWPGSMRVRVLSRFT